MRCDCPGKTECVGPWHNPDVPRLPHRQSPPTPKWRSAPSPRGPCARTQTSPFHYNSIVIRGKIFFGAVDFWGNPPEGTVQGGGLSMGAEGSLRPLLPKGDRLRLVPVKHLRAPAQHPQEEGWLGEAAEDGAGNCSWKCHALFEGICGPAITTASLHHCITASLHYCITASLHHEAFTEGPSGLKW